MSTILLYVGVTVLGDALAQTGAAEVLAKSLAGLLGGVTNGYIIGFAVYLAGFIMTSLLYNRAVSTVLIPLVVITCSSIGCDPRGPVILCVLAEMSSLITPMATAVVPMAMNAGGYSQKTIFCAGIIPGLVRGIAGTLIAMSIYPAFH
jgi:di/tricarboxylate transporter